MSSSVATAVSEPRLDFVTCASTVGLHRMAYWEWGDPDNDRVLLCVHGLTRSGRDFDVLAQRLSSDYRVVCPDVAGRGKSDWLMQSAAYALPQYVADMVTLIGRLRVNTLDWVGTSMGGLIGLGLAGALAMSEIGRLDRGRYGLSSAQQLRLGKMVLNDVGPRLSGSGLGRIAEYVGLPVRFDTFAQAVDYVRQISSGFGQHTPQQWEALTRYVFVQQDDGSWTKHYDLRIAEPMLLQSPAVLQGSEAVLWASYEALDQPILLVRGQQSDLLTRQTADEMLRRNPLTQLYEVADAGHAPSLMHDDQVARIAAFLLGQDGVSSTSASHNA